MYNDYGCGHMKKDQLLKVRLTKKQKNLIKGKAKARGLTMSECVEKDLGLDIYAGPTQKKKRV